MPELRLVEHYSSTQGEGRNTGIVTQFVRFAGCNMRCPLWPCDTQHAIQPSIWRHNSYKTTPEELFIATRNKPGKNICLTGGEPFMQDHKKLKLYVNLLVRNGYSIEAFSNGSYIYPEWAIDQLHFTMDWKLPGSGEAETALVERNENALQLKSTDDIKFVVADRGDLQHAVDAWERLTENDVRCGFFVGAAWDRITSEQIVKFILDLNLPWKLNFQVHKVIWNPNKQGV